MAELIIVAAGGAFGAVSRYVIGIFAASRWGAQLPVGTFFANCIGCFVIGFFLMVAINRADISPLWRLLVVTGFCGGLTTFSSFSYETIRLAQGGDYFQAALNIFLNMVAGFSLTVAGMWLADKF